MENVLVKKAIPSIEDFKKMELKYDYYWHNLFQNYVDMVEEDLKALETVEEVKEYAKNIVIPISLSRNPLAVNDGKDKNGEYVGEWIVDYDNPTLVREPITFKMLAHAEYLTKVYERCYQDYNDFTSFNDILYARNLNAKIKFLSFKRKCLSSLSDWATNGCNLKVSVMVGSFINWFENKYPNHAYLIKHNVDMTLKFNKYIEYIAEYLDNKEEVLEDYTDEWAVRDLKEDVINTIKWCVFDSDTMSDALHFYISDNTPLEESIIK